MKIVKHDIVMTLCKGQVESIKKDGYCYKFHNKKRVLIVLKEKWKTWGRKKDLSKKELQMELFRLRKENAKLKGGATNVSSL